MSVVLKMRSILFMQEFSEIILQRKLQWYLNLYAHISVKCLKNIYIYIKQERILYKENNFFIIWIKEKYEIRLLKKRFHASIN